MKTLKKTYQRRIKWPINIDLRYEKGLVFFIFFSGPKPEEGCQDNMSALDFCQV